jgi:hypothetical protein
VQDPRAALAQLLKRHAVLITNVTSNSGWLQRRSVAIWFLTNKTERPGGAPLSQTKGTNAASPIGAMPGDMFSLQAIEAALASAAKVDLIAYSLITLAIFPKTARPKLLALVSRHWQLLVRAEMALKTGAKWCACPRRCRFRCLSTQAVRVMRSMQESARSLVWCNA